MAVRSQDLIERDAAVYAFPPIRARRAQRRAVLRRRVALLAVGLIVGGASLFATGSEGIAPAAAKTRTVRVQARQSLWELAEKHAPMGTDTRAYLDSILELNEVSVVVEPGTRIKLP